MCRFYFWNYKKWNDILSGKMFSHRENQLNSELLMRKRFEFLNLNERSLRKIIKNYRVTKSIISVRTINHLNAIISINSIIIATHLNILGKIWAACAHSCYNYWLWWLRRSHFRNLQKLIRSCLQFVTPKIDLPLSNPIKSIINFETKFVNDFCPKIFLYNAV